VRALDARDNLGIDGEERRLRIRNRLSVAGAGFEPATFGL
jgi:hypothetical protein